MQLSPCVIREFRFSGGSPAAIMWGHSWPQGPQLALVAEAYGKVGEVAARIFVWEYRSLLYGCTVR
jgi:hypothetical protein